MDLGRRHLIVVDKFDLHSIGLMLSLKAHASAMQHRQIAAGNYASWSQATQLSRSRCAPQQAYRL